MTEVGEKVSKGGASTSSTTEPRPECQYLNRNFRTNFRGRDSIFVTSTQIATRRVAFRLEVNLAGNHVRITSIFRWGSVAADITNDERTDTIRKFKREAARWSGRFRMKITDPICGERTLPIRFRLLWSPNDTSAAAPYQVDLVRNHPRANVTGWNVAIGYDSDVVPDAAWVLGHEYAHTVCLPDEYFYAGVTSATVVYKKADRTTKTVQLEPPDNIMKTHNSRIYKKRFYFFVAIKAQELLRRESGRDVTCEIV